MWVTCSSWCFFCLVFYIPLKRTAGVFTPVVESDATHLKFLQSSGCPSHDRGQRKCYWRRCQTGEVFKQTCCRHIQTDQLFFYCQVNQVATACKTKYWCCLVYLVALWRAKTRHGVSLPSGNSELCDSSLSFNMTAPWSTRSNIWSNIYGTIPSQTLV